MVGRTIPKRLTAAVLYFLSGVFIAGAAMCDTGEESAENRVEVTLSYSAEEAAWRAEYRLFLPVREFQFADTSASSLRSNNWRTEGATVAVRDNQLDSQSPFLEFTIRLPGDDVEHDRIQPAVIPVGEGSLVNLSYLQGRRPTAIAVNVDYGQHFVTPESESVPGRAAVAVDVPEGKPYYVYLGPGPVESHDSFRIIVGGNVPNWIDRAVREHVAAAVDEYAAYLGFELEFTPTVYVSYREQSPDRGWRGDTSSGGVISIRFRAGAWQQSDSGKAESIRRFVRHETFHLLNSGSKVNASQPWLHEGAAEYFAEYGTVRLDAMLLECWERGDPYSCGHAANLVGDRLLAERDGATMRDAWRAVEYGHDRELNGRGN